MDNWFTIIRFTVYWLKKPVLRSFVKLCSTTLTREHKLREKKNIYIGHTFDDAVIKSQSDSPTRSRLRLVVIYIIHYNVNVRLNRTRPPRFHGDAYYRILLFVNVPPRSIANHFSFAAHVFRSNSIASLCVQTTIRSIHRYIYAGCQRFPWET